MGSVHTIILVGIIFGIVQLVAGVAIGRSLPSIARRLRKAKTLDPEQLQKFGHQLYQLATTVADDVGQHQSRIEEVSQVLGSAQDSNDTPLAKVVLRTITQVMETNQQLQDRLVEAEEKLQEQSREIESHFTEARTDSLTELPNRRAFDDELIRRISEWQRKKTLFCLLTADLDRFKRLNDHYGHAAGDAVLQHVAEVFKYAVREMDLIARVGGEEFTVILPATSSHDAQVVAERIRAIVEAAVVRFETHDIRVTVSLGIAEVLLDDDSSSILRRADLALYASKRSGRNCVHFHDGRCCTKVVWDVDQANQASASPGDSEMSTLCEDLRQRITEVSKS